jgi:hypothetical protein
MKRRILLTWLVAVTLNPPSASAMILAIGDSLSIPDRAARTVGFGPELRGRLRGIDERVYFHGVCGSSPSYWIDKVEGQCGSTSILSDRPIILGGKVATPQISELVKDLEPLDPVVIELGTNTIAAVTSCGPIPKEAASRETRDAACFAQLKEQFLKKQGKPFNDIVRMIAKIGDRPCVWIGTPPYNRPTDATGISWQKTRDLNQMMPEILEFAREQAKHAFACKYVPSFTAKDGGPELEDDSPLRAADWQVLHPAQDIRKEWVDRIWAPNSAGPGVDASVRFMRKRYEALKAGAGAVFKQGEESPLPKSGSSGR